MSSNRVPIVAPQAKSMCDSIPLEYGWNHQEDDVDGKKYLLSHGRMRQLLAFQRMRLGRCWVRAPAYYKSVCHCLWHASAQIVPNSCRGPDGRDSGALAGQQLAELSFSWWCQSLSLNPANWVELRDWREKVRKVHRPSQLAPCPSLELRHCGFNPPMRHWAQMAPWTKYNMLCNMPNMQHQGRFKEFLEL